ncbi:cell envelope biogenesis protein TolA [Sphingomonas sp. SFZ2018-12]|uniref:cell envelope biogenesis protein TolA n=1 Tax=Sphingomonas sp. SFZ2018-12 TaxID=2683197 RepID=UPI001F0DF726|nr:cell envelope biogenesis protein TolA [Sphingomonas sp. SFZ2018-12]
MSAATAGPGRAEWAGIAVAAIAHVALFGLLSLGFLETPNPLNLKSKAIDVSLIDDVALEAAAPVTADAPATSIAPDAGPPEDAAPAEPVRPLPEPEPVAPPAPKAAPPPRPEPAASPKPPTPARAERKPEPAKAEAKPAPKTTTAKASGSDPAAKRPRPTGARLGSDFLKGIVDRPSAGKAQTPRAANVGAQAVAGLADAIARQVQPCANRIPNPGPGANLIRSRIRLQMKPDGTMAVRPELRGQTGVNDGNQRYAQRVAELAIAAFIQCAPYTLPAELYEGGWEDIIINYRLPE